MTQNDSATTVLRLLTETLSFVHEITDPATTGTLVSRLEGDKPVVARAAGSGVEKWAHVLVQLADNEALESAQQAVSTVDAEVMRLLGELKDDRDQKIDALTVRAIQGLASKIQAQHTLWKTIVDSLEVPLGLLLQHMKEVAEQHGGSVDDSSFVLSNDNTKIKLKKRSLERIATDNGWSNDHPVRKVSMRDVKLLARALLSHLSSEGWCDVEEWCNSKNVVLEDAIDESFVDVLLGSQTALIRVIRKEVCREFDLPHDDASLTQRFQADMNESVHVWSGKRRRFERDASERGLTVYRWVSAESLWDAYEQMQKKEPFLLAEADEEKVSAWARHWLMQALWTEVEWEAKIAPTPSQLGKVSA